MTERKGYVYFIAYGRRHLYCAGPATWGPRYINEFGRVLCRYGQVGKKWEHCTLGTMTVTHYKVEVDSKCHLFNTLLSTLKYNTAESSVF